MTLIFMAFDLSVPLEIRIHTKKSEKQIESSLKKFHVNEIIFFRLEFKMKISALFIRNAYVNHSFLNNNNSNFQSKVSDNLLYWFVSIEIFMMVNHCFNFFGWQRENGSERVRGETIFEMCAKRGNEWKERKSVGNVMGHLNLYDSFIFVDSCHIFS